MHHQFNIQQFHVLHTHTHTVFMCFVWIWEQTAIISLYSINSLVCITETQCVYCAVRIGSLKTIPFQFSLQNAWQHLCVFCDKSNWFLSFPSDLLHKYSCLLHPSSIVVKLINTNITFRNPEKQWNITSHFHTHTNWLYEWTVSFVRSWMSSAFPSKKTLQQ